MSVHNQQEPLTKVLGIRGGDQACVGPRAQNSGSTNLRPFTAMAGDPLIVVRTPETLRKASGSGGKVQIAGAPTAAK